MQLLKEFNFIYHTNYSKSKHSSVQINTFAGFSNLFLKNIWLIICSTDKLKQQRYN